MLYPQNGDCIVTIDFVTSLHPNLSCHSVETQHVDIVDYTACTVGLLLKQFSSVRYSIARKREDVSSESVYRRGCCDDHSKSASEHYNTRPAVSNQLQRRHQHNMAADIGQSRSTSG